MKITFEDLELGPVLGSGTVGTVYRSTLKPTGETVAVKILQSTISRDALIRARFQREMAILERLKHPNIIRYFGGGKHDDQLFYAMESLESGTAKELLERAGTMTWQEVASIGRQVCSALQHAHNYGIIHRDLKPSNLFLTTSGQIKLGDFGIALDTHAADLTHQGLTVGTHAYMSPEQITGSPVTGKADLYSLGCVLFELLTGRKPYEGLNFAVLFEQHLRADPPHVRDFVPHCPQELDELIVQLLAKKPEDRPFNARAVQGVLMELLEKKGNQEAKAELVSTKSGEIVQSSDDVGAEMVRDAGMESLARRMNVEAREVTTGRLVVLLAVVAVVIALVAVVSNR